MMMKNLETNKTKVLIVDDHPIVRQGLSMLLNQNDDMEVCCEAEGLIDAVHAIELHKPDIAIIDITLKDGSGLDLIREIKVRGFSISILVLSVHDEAIYAERALRAGAKGYIMKEELTEKVVDAVRKIIHGKVYLSDAMSSRMLDKLAGGADYSSGYIDGLSDRELEVFKLIGKGFGTREISEKMNVSPKTIQSYRARIKEKLNLEKTAELQQIAFQWCANDKI